MEGVGTRFDWIKDAELCMSDEQLEAHKFLIASEDLVPCPQGILLKRSACELRQSAFDHHQHACHIWKPDEEPTSIKFIGCVEFGCEHYVPRRQRVINPGKTERYMATVRAKSEATDKKLREKQKAEKTKQQKEHAAKVAAMIAKRLAEKQAKREARAAKLGPMIEQAKKMHEAGTSFLMIAKHFSVGKTTVARWFMNAEQIAQDRQRWGQIRKGNADV